MENYIPPFHDLTLPIERTGLWPPQEAAYILSRFSSKALLRPLTQRYNHMDQSLPSRSPSTPACPGLYQLPCRRGLYTLEGLAMSREKGVLCTSDSEPDVGARNWRRGCCYKTYSRRGGRYGSRAHRPNPAHQLCGLGRLS